MSLLVSHYLAFDVILDRLAKLEAGYKLSDDVDWIENAGLYGLSRFTDPNPENPKVGRFYDEDIYFVRSGSGEVSDIITCDRQSDLPYRSCNHRIEGDNADIKIRYPPEFLADWQRISQMSADFFRCMENM